MSDSTPQYTDVSVTSKEYSEIEIKGEVPVEAVHSHRTKALRALTSNLELPGFRRGHVPEDMALEHIGEAVLMQETAERALSHVYPLIVSDHKLDVVGRPQVSITKLAPGNPIGFTITTAVYPTVELPDYKKIAEKERANHDHPESVTVTDDEIDEELKKLQEMMGQAAGNRERGTGNGEQGDANDAERDSEAKEGVEQNTLPELNDEFAKQLGSFETLADLKATIKKGKLSEKQQKAREKRRIALADAVLAKAKLEVPGVFVEGELDQMLASFEDRVKRAGLELEQYLEQAQKTKEDLRKEWRPDAEKRAKLQIVLAEIAKAESFTPDAERLEREVGHIKEHYPDAEESAVRSYVGAQMLNEEVFAMLEGEKDGGEKSKEHGEQESERGESKEEGV